MYDNGEEGFEGLTTVVGGKYTTSRGLAEGVMKMVAGELGRDLGNCETAKRHLAADPDCAATKQEMKTRLNRWLQRSGISSI